jgi:hypothetical protein
MCGPVGIRFVNLDEAQREQVAELYEHAIKKAIEDARGRAARQVVNLRFRFGNAPDRNPR